MFRVYWVYRVYCARLLRDAAACLSTACLLEQSVVGHHLSLGERWQAHIGSPVAFAVTISLDLVLCNPTSAEFHQRPPQLARMRMLLLIREGVEEALSRRNQWRSEVMCPCDRQRQLLSSGVNLRLEPRNLCLCTGISFNPWVNSSGCME